jgi:Domain of unknown function (DUF3883)
LNNQNYTVPNRRSPNQFGVKVNKTWFKEDSNNISKPQIRRRRQDKEIDWNLFPIGDKIFVVHYLKLREYALQLENDREKWFNSETWGMVIDPDAGNFYWYSNNTKFPLTQIYNADDFPGLENNLDYPHKKYLVDSPRSSKRIKKGKLDFRAKIVDFAEIGKANAELGHKGEEFIFEWEKRRLQEIGHPEFAEKVKWTSNEEGDGAGFDILSFEETGEPRYIEVKTTTQGIDSPFLITKNEVEFSKAHYENYYLYRVFDFEVTPLFFWQKGDLAENFELMPKLFEARIQPAAER